MAVAIPARLTAREGRRFAFTVGTAFLVLAGIAAWRGRVVPPRIFGTLGGLLLVAGLFVPGRLGGVHRAWMRLADGISKVTAPIVVAGVYFVVLSPIGIVMKAFGRNPLRHKVRNGSLWLPASSGGRSDSSKISFRRRFMASSVGQLWKFLKVRKKWWLLPILMMLWLVAVMLVLAQGSALAPFIYTIF